MEIKTIKKRWSKLNPEVINDMQPIIQDIQTLLQRIKRLESIIEKKDEALRKYADRRNWGRIVWDSYYFRRWRKDEERPDGWESSGWEIAEQALALTVEDGEE